MSFSRLDPADSLAEILFGLIMVLTFTLGAGVAANHADVDPRIFVIAATGCNVAWGMIDAVFYLMGVIFVRSRHVRLLRRFHKQTNPELALAAIAAELDPVLDTITRHEDRDQLYQAAYDLLEQTSPTNARFHRHDFREALEVFLLVSATAVPAAIPFFFINDPWLALRISNLLLVSLLFLVGQTWARCTGIKPWFGGLGFTVIGLILVSIAIALGG